jgi:hypothetical protein
MKTSDNRLDKVEETLIAAHRRQEDLQFPPEWRQQVLQDIKSLPKPAAVPQEKEGVFISFKKIRLVAALSLAVFMGWLILANMDWQDPWVYLKHDKTAHKSHAAFLLEAGDDHSGLRNLTVTVTQKEQKIEVLAKDFEPQGGPWYSKSDVVNKVNIPLMINPQELGLKEGELTIIIIARDLSWRNGFKGNEITHEKMIYISHDEKTP